MIAKSFGYLKYLALMAVVLEKMLVVVVVASHVQFGAVIPVAFVVENHCACPFVSATWSLYTGGWVSGAYCRGPAAKVQGGCLGLSAATPQ